MLFSSELTERVWGGVSLEGRTVLQVLANSILTAVGYRDDDESSEPTVRPYACAVGPGFRHEDPGVLVPGFQGLLKGFGLFSMDLSQRDSRCPILGSRITDRSLGVF